MKPGFYFVHNGYKNFLSASFDVCLFAHRSSNSNFFNSVFTHQSVADCVSGIGCCPGSIHSCEGGNNNVLVPTFGSLSCSVHFGAGIMAQFICL
jgi:hypothetical protein